MYHRTFWSPFRFFLKKSDNLGQKLVNFFLGVLSTYYSMLKYMGCVHRNLPVHFLSFSRILQHWLNIGEKEIEKSLLTFCPRLHIFSTDCLKGQGIFSPFCSQFLYVHHFCFWTGNRGKVPALYVALSDRFLYVSSVSVRVSVRQITEQKQ